MPIVTDSQDRNANPDPLRTLSAEVDAKGIVHFTVDFQAPGSFQGMVVPASADEPGGVVAYVYSVNEAALNEDVEPVTCLDTYDIDLPALPVLQTETVFRQGFEAGWGAKASERIYSEEEEADEAWSESGLQSPTDDTTHDTPADLARALEAGVALVQALVDARLAGTSMVEASLSLEDWAVAAADLLPE